MIIRFQHLHLVEGIKVVAVRVKIIKFYNVENGKYSKLYF